MDEKIINMITQLVETGSTSALWFYGIYVGGSILKFVVGFGCVFLSVKHFSAALLKICGEKNV